MDLIKTTQQILCHPEKMHKMPVIVQKYTVRICSQNFFVKNTIASNEVEGKCQSQGSPACWDPSGRVHTRTMYILVQIESKKETAIYLPLKKCTNYTVILILYSTRICTPCRQYV